MREYYLFELADINPKNDVIKEEFIYIDLESVNQGILCQKILITKNDAPSRAQRTVKLNDILFQMVRPYQKNNYIMKELFFCSITNANRSTILWLTITMSISIR